LERKGYDIIGCKWFKNGKEEIYTNTINEYSYSAGPREIDLLELAPTYYSFQITTQNGTLLNSTVKMLTEYKYDHELEKYKLSVYPNPVHSGSLFTLKGVAKDKPIEVYNQLGICVSRSTATDDYATLVLELPAGIYIIRNHNKEVKVTILR
jgi:hypothetical protein